MLDVVVGSVGVVSQRGLVSDRSDPWRAGSGQVHGFRAGQAAQRAGAAPTRALTLERAEAHRYERRRICGLQSLNAT